MFVSKILLMAALSLSMQFLLVHSKEEYKVCDTKLCHDLSTTYKQNMDPTVNPCNNFYKYACGTFPKYHSEDSFEQRQTELEKELDEAVNDAATKSNSHAVRYVTQLYQECNNTELLDSIGTKPLLKVIDSVVGGWPILRQKKANNETTKHWPTLYEQMFAKLGISPIFLIKIQYLSFSNRRVITILPGSTGIGFELLNEPEKHKKVIQAYRTYLRSVAIMLGAPDDQQLAKDIDAILALETKLANLRKDMIDTTRFKTIDTLNKLSKKRIDWLQTLNYIVNETHSKVAQFQWSDLIGTGNATFFQNATKILEETPIETLENLFGWMVALKYGPLTTNKYREIEHQYRSVITGSKRQVAHWEACYNFANNKLPFAVSRVYVDKHFTSEDKKEATAMIDKIQESFREIMKHEGWLDEKTMEKGLEKLDAIKKNVAYPEWILSDELDKYYYVLKDHQVVKGNFFESAVALSPLLIKNSLDGISTPINHTLLWPMSPVTVNAAYMLNDNSITIPAAVLKSSFFDKNRPISLNFGSIGSIVGHELTHGFDSLGRLFDKNGQLNNWWTPKTMGEFMNKSFCFVKQYSDIFDPIAKLNLKGSQTLNENIADNAGIRESYDAFRLYQSIHKKYETLPGLYMTPEQLFFIAYANMWCSVSDAETLKNQILTDVHSPDQYRVNIPLTNFAQFSQAFHCPLDSPMNPNINDRCYVW